MDSFEVNVTWTNKDNIVLILTNVNNNIVLILTNVNNNIVIIL